MNWIKVEDRLPEEKEYVLVWASPYKPTMNGKHIAISARSPGRTGEPNNFVGQRKVFCWQPLPEPPKE